jgi:hypothetical protein
VFLLQGENLEFTRSILVSFEINKVCISILKDERKDGKLDSDIEFSLVIFKELYFGEWCCMPVISATQEVEAGRL